MAKVPIGIERLPKILTGYVGCTNVTVTDDRQTDDRRTAIAYSDREDVVVGLLSLWRQYLVKLKHRVFSGQRLWYPVVCDCVITQDTLHHSSSSQWWWCLNRATPCQHQAHTPPSRRHPSQHSQLIWMHRPTMQLVSLVATVCCYITEVWYCMVL